MNTSYNTKPMETSSKNRASVESGENFRYTINYQIQGED